MLFRLLFKDSILLSIDKYFLAFITFFISKVFANVFTALISGDGQLPSEFFH